MSEKLKVPDEWCCVNHIDIAEINPKFDINQFKEDVEVSFLPMASVKEISGNYDLSKSRKLSAVKKGYTHFKNGDIIFAKITPCMENGKIAVLDNLLNGIGFGSTEFHVSRPYHDINAQFLFYYFVQSAFRKKAQRIMTGSAGQLRVSTEYFKNVNIPLPPLSEQRAIVSKIEQLFSDLDNGIENFKKAQEQLKIYRQAVLKKAFEGELTKKWREEQTDLPSADELLQHVKEEREKHYQKQLDVWNSAVKDWEDNGKEGKKPTRPKKPIKSEPISGEELETLKQTPKGWAVSRFIDLIKYEKNAIKRGPFGSVIKKSFFVPSGYKVYEQQNAIKDDETLGNYCINEEKFKELDGFSVKGGDYIVSCSGTIGRIHKLPIDCEPGVINQALLKIVLDEKLMLSKYFLYFFRSDVFQRKILKGTRGTGMQNLASVGEIKSSPIQIPPKTEQNQIVQEIETRLPICDKMETTIAKSLQKSEALRQSILKKAFEGKLLSENELEEVRNAPDWEPAEKLLERIKAEKNND